MKRRTFLGTLAAFASALAIGASPKAQVTATGILRRKEYKRKRWYKRRAYRRNPLPRYLKRVYGDQRDHLLAMNRLLAHLERFPVTNKAWGGNGVYWDVTSNADAGPATTRDTPQGAVPVHSAVSGSASRRFWRNPFLA